MLPIPIRNPFPGAACWLVPETDSTMDEARRLAGAGWSEGTVIAADRQTAGRGRFRDRSWVSQPGRDLTFTLILPGSAREAAGLPLRAGLALHRAVRDLAVRMGTGIPAGLEIKWPNDLLVGGRKTAGILCEVSGGGCFLGVGVNCGRPGDAGFRTEASGLAEELGGPVDRFLLLELFLGRMAEVLDEEDWPDEVARRLWLRGRPARFRTGLAEPGGPGTAVLDGRVAGIGPAGELILETPDGPVGLVSGEVSPAGPLRSEGHTPQGIDGGRDTR